MINGTTRFSCKEKKLKPVFRSWSGKELHNFGGAFCLLNSKVEVGARASVKFSPGAATLVKTNVETTFHFMLYDNMI
jgi:hypothetical protein